MSRTWETEALQPGLPQPSGWRRGLRTGEQQFLCLLQIPCEVGGGHASTMEIIAVPWRFGPPSV